MATETVHFADGSAWLASIGPKLVVANWFGAATLASAGPHTEALVACARRAREPVGLLTIIDGGVPLPDQPVRTTINDALKSIEAQITRQAIVIEGSGFGASAIRAMVAGMSLVARPTHPVKVFGDVRGAVPWATHPTTALAARELEESVRSLRRRYGRDPT